MMKAWTGWMVGLLVAGWMVSCGPVTSTNEPGVEAGIEKTTAENSTEATLTEATTEAASEPAQEATSAKEPGPEPKAEPTQEPAAEQVDGNEPGAEASSEPAPETSDEPAAEENNPTDAGTPQDKAPGDTAPQDAGTPDTTTQPDQPLPDDCNALLQAFKSELQNIQSCSEDKECGQVLQGTSCGCTRNKVARNSADTTRFFAIIKKAGSLGCPLPLVSTCDCPRTYGYQCVQGVCAHKYNP
ncbi:MAG: hypothetical protein EP343_34570 [Deltaproteobacteria bacterium]|nr:MAG: hypothetical protein EP343_34570 [Deltaproteobacteria bacterium]